MHATDYYVHQFYHFLIIIITIPAIFIITKKILMIMVVLIVTITISMMIMIMVLIAVVIMISRKALGQCRSSLLVSMIHSRYLLNLQPEFMNMINKLQILWLDTHSIGMTCTEAGVLREAKQS